MIFKSKLSKILKLLFLSIYSLLLISCSSNKISLSDNDYKILNEIVPLINETYYNRNYLVDANVSEGEFWNMLIECYENDFENFKKYESQIDLIENLKLKEALNNYSKGTKPRLEAYRYYKDNNIDFFERFLSEADMYIYPSLITLIEEFKIDANKPLKKEYEFIKYKLDL